MITIYGIKSCDTCRKARKWMDDEGIGHRYHDFREDGIDAPTLRKWVSVMGWETLLNRRSTTWRQLPETERAAIDPGRAIELMLANPTLIKRPVFEIGDDDYLVGFGENEKRQLRLAG